MAICQSQLLDGIGNGLGYCITRSLPLIREILGPGSWFYFILLL
jgi:Na+-transporting NADH:ubiquinone oxidoreductase subunit NqrD